MLRESDVALSPAVADLVFVRPFYAHPKMNLWSPSRTELDDLPGIHPQSDGSIDFEFSDDEQSAVDAFFKLLE